MTCKGKKYNQTIEYDKNNNPIVKLEPRVFPYKSLKDPKYIQDRNETFRANGNGWWFSVHQLLVKGIHHG